MFTCLVSSKFLCLSPIIRWYFGVYDKRILKSWDIQPPSSHLFQSGWDNILAKWKTVTRVEYFSQIGSQIKRLYHTVEDIKTDMFGDVTSIIRIWCYRAKINQNQNAIVFKLYSFPPNMSAWHGQWNQTRDSCEQFWCSCHQPSKGCVLAGEVHLTAGDGAGRTISNSDRGGTSHPRKWCM